MTRDEYEAGRQTLLRIHDGQIDLPPMAELELGGFVGSVHLSGCVSSHPSPWFVGPFAFLMRDPVPARFVPWRGELGFFNVEYDTAMQICCSTYAQPAATASTEQPLPADLRPTLMRIIAAKKQGFALPASDLKVAHAAWKRYPTEYAALDAAGLLPSPTLRAAQPQVGLRL
jgi:hypothetical protein